MRKTRSDEASLSCSSFLAEGADGGKCFIENSFCFIMVIDDSRSQLRKNRISPKFLLDGLFIKALSRYTWIFVKGSEYEVT